MGNLWLHRYAVLLAVCTLFLVIAGASVTSNQAGLSVPDWPLSYGQVMPEMKGGVFFEHGHRMVASAVGFLTIILAIWLWRADDRPWMRKLGWLALAAVILQGLLGGLTVRYLLPKPVSIAHACLAQLFFSLTVVIAMFTSPAWRNGPVYVQDTGWPSLRFVSLLTSLAVLAQVALGAGFRHRAFGVTPHILGAMLVTALLLLLCAFVLTQYGSHSILRRSAWVLIGITFLQVLLGIAAYMARLTVLNAVAPSLAAVVLTVFHVATGALTMAASAAITVQVFRNVRSRERDVSSPEFRTAS
ncbi:MAG TPA: COX15/CtaA family protein [Bryobacteraceae bacterium]|nr:COX15/CtaA family protein [Bryobacteraceae bacterium]